MPNVINYATKFEPFLMQKYATESRSHLLTQSNPQVTWLNEKTIKIPELIVSGYKDHTRTIGFNSGAVENKWTPYVLEHDRDIEFWLDPMDVDESNLTASIANVQSVFEETQAIPETDSYRFSKLYADFVDNQGVVDTTAITAANALSWFDTNMEAMDDAGVPEEGRILYVTPSIHKAFKTAEGIQRQINVNGSNDGKLDRKIYSLDDVEMIKVPKARFKTAYDFADGCVPGESAEQINAILIHPSAIIARERYAYIKVFMPGSDSRTGDGYLYQNRKYQGLVVLQNRIEGIAINADA